MKLTVDIEKRMGGFLLQSRFETGDGPLALLGASGCGKSVTLRCVAGILTPDRGRIALGDTVLYDSAAKISLTPQRRRVGYLFQQYALFPNMTLRQNIESVIHNRACRQKRTDVLLERFRLTEQAALRPRQLSGGQQQRAALARILASEPSAILLDEPFSALDSHLKGRLEPELAEALAAFSGPVVWVTHDPGEARRNCSQVCVMEDGRTEPVRSMKDLFANPGTRSAARLTGCENDIAATPVGNAVELPAWGIRLSCEQPVPPETTAVGIRARSLRPSEKGADNAFPCRVTRAAEDVSGWSILLRPLSAAPGTPLLRMALKTGSPIPAPGEVLWAAVPSDEILLLR